MSHSQHVGIQAFPHGDPTNGGDHGRELRDYFAASALQGLMANPRRYDYITTEVRLGALTNEEASYKNAYKAYKIADAMMKAGSE